MRKTECEKFICAFSYRFINDNWDKIDLKRMDLKETKEKFLKEVKSNFETAFWVITEIMDYGTDTDYSHDLYVYQEEDEDNNMIKFRVMKLDNKYIKYTMNKDYTHTVSFAEPKTKTVIYFD
jgi:hypothetical protein